MGDLGITLALIVLAVMIVLLAVRLRRTASIAGSVQLKDQSGKRLSVEEVLAKEVAASGLGRPVVTISMTTRTGKLGDENSTEAITIDGQTYHSVDEIPPEVRDRVRTLLSKARAKGDAAGPRANAQIARMERDLAALGLDLHEDPASTEDPPSAR